MVSANVPAVGPSPTPATRSSAHTRSGTDRTTARTCNASQLAAAIGPFLVPEVIPVLHNRSHANAASGIAIAADSVVAIRAVAAVVNVALRATVRNDRERSGGKNPAARWPTDVQTWRDMSRRRLTCDVQAAHRSRTSDPADKIHPAPIRS